VLEIKGYFAMGSQIMKMTLLPDVDPAAFEKALKENIIPDTHVFLRTVRDEAHRLFKSNSGSSVYIWLVFTDLVGSTPETAGEGPNVLLRGSLPEPLVESVRAALADLATVDLMNEF
jgi:hypothetical protein